MAAPPDRAAPLPHDAAYKAMYRHPQAVRDLFRYLVAPRGPLGPETVAALDLGSVAKLPAEWVTADFRRRHGDQVWCIRFREAPDEAGAGAWLLLLLEFQSRDDIDMALRVLGYVVELYRDLEAQGVVRAGTRRPPVLPVVIHNGESPWRAPVRVAELIALPRVPARVRRELRALQPAQRLHVVDFPRHRQEDLAPGNVVSLQIAFEHAGDEDYARLLPALAEIEDAGLRRTVYEWVARRARHHGLPLEDLDVEGTHFRSRIGENMKRATETWFAQGQAEVMRRQAARKFDAATAERLAGHLERMKDPERMGEIGEWIIECEHGEELLERVERLGVASADGGAPSRG